MVLNHQIGVRFPVPLPQRVHPDDSSEHPFERSLLFEVIRSPSGVNLSGPASTSRSPHARIPARSSTVFYRSTLPLTDVFSESVTRAANAPPSSICSPHH